MCFNFSCTSERETSWKLILVLCIVETKHDQTHLRGFKQNKNTSPNCQFSKKSHLSNFIQALDTSHFLKSLKINQSHELPLPHTPKIQQFAPEKWYLEDETSFRGPAYF